MILFAIGRCTKCAGLQTAKIHNAGGNNRDQSGTSGAGRVYFVQNRRSFLPLNLSTARQLLAEVLVIAPSEIKPGFSLRVFLILAGHLGDKSKAPLIEVFVESLWLV
jgi:hypothetical protein